MCESKRVQGKDLFRDTWARYLGYANEVGESFRPLVAPRIVRYSYYVAFAYVFADTADKSFRSLRNDGRFTSVIIEAGDALIWQTLASVIIPGLTINRISHYSQRALMKYAHPKYISQKNIPWVTVGIGLLSIPFIIRPIDTGVTIFMNLTFRKLFRGDC